MSRSGLRQAVLDRNGNVQVGISVHVYEPGTTGPIAATMHSAVTGGTTLANPLTTDANGEFAFWLDTPQAVDLYVVEGAVSRTIPSVAVGSAGGGGGGVSLTPIEFTIANGAIDVSGITADFAYIRVNGEGNADDVLNTILGGHDGMTLIMEQGTSFNNITLTAAVIGSEDGLFNADLGRGSQRNPSGDGVLGQDNYWATLFYSEMEGGNWGWNMDSDTVSGKLPYIATVYTVATPGDWVDPAPITIASALDTLAARVKALE